MKLSVFTASHDLKHIDRPLNSLLSQTHKDFEWVILLNGKACDESEKLKKKLGHKSKEHGLNFVIHNYGNQSNNNIGALKKACASLCSGEVLVELDHDDALREDCLEKLSAAFSNDKIDFVYSDDYYVDLRGGKEKFTVPFSENSGWKIGVDNQGRKYNLGHDPSAITFSYIYYAPDHVRAWRSSFYQKIGGHNVNLDVCDDFELCCRTYIEGECLRIPEPLYFYNLHEEQTFRNEKNERIQELTHELHDKFIHKIVEKWCDKNNLLKVDLCSCNNKPKGYVGIDKRKLNADDIVYDLEKPNWPFEDGSVGVFRANDAVEHLRDPINTMSEIYRCLADFGWVMIEVPSTDGRGAFQDPTHVSFWNSNSFWYYTKEHMAHFIGSPVAFKDYRLLNYFPTEWHRTHDIPYTKAHLVKLPKDKSIIPPGGREI
jgi:glycosyltransferase involved in cell wall biosynthesis